jgi:RNA polymerase sigma factor (sigma-70 family)
MTVIPFQQVLDAHRDRVWRVVVATAGPQDADDAFQEAWLSALRAYPRLPEGANVEAWLVTIAHRRALDLVRKRKRHAVPVPELPEQLGNRDGVPVGAGGDPHDADDLWTALRRLPDKQRQTIAYHYLAGLPYAEVAAIVGGTPEAARLAAADGVKRLRGVLAVRPA